MCFFFLFFPNNYLGDFLLNFYALTGGSTFPRSMMIISRHSLVNVLGCPESLLRFMRK